MFTLSFPNCYERWSSTSSFMLHLYSRFSFDHFHFFTGCFISPRYVSLYEIHHCILRWYFLQTLDPTFSPSFPLLFTFSSFSLLLFSRCFSVSCVTLHEFPFFTFSFLFLCCHWNGLMEMWWNWRVKVLLFDFFFSIFLSFFVRVELQSTHFQHMIPIAYVRIGQTNRRKDIRNRKQQQRFHVRIRITRPSFTCFQGSFLLISCIFTGNHQHSLTHSFVQISYWRRNVQTQPPATLL